MKIIGLAPTGTPIFVGPAGLLLIGLGLLVYRRSRGSRGRALEGGKAAARAETGPSE